MKSLVLFTASYPYGNKETYLENEINVLSNSFDKLIIYPHYYNSRSDIKRSVPNNVIVKKPLLPRSNAKRITRFILDMFRNPLVYALSLEFFKYCVFLDSSKLKNWVLALVDSTIGHSDRDFKKIVESENTIFYFYWGMGWSYNLIGLKKHLSNRYMVRLHGGEVYLERSNGYIPLRKLLFDKADDLVTISRDLKEYLQTEFKIRDSKIFISPLGTLFHGMNPDISEPNKIFLASCSNMIKLKRLDLIIEALSSISSVKVEWVHFGDGEEREPMKQLADKKLGPNISYSFKGSVPNVEIMDYYKNNHVDAFINVSAYEGVPVSIMEAISFGIPIIATDVGATRELVHSETGVLLHGDCSISSLKDSILKVKDLKWVNLRKSSHVYWKSSFESNTNYSKLVKYIKG